MELADFNWISSELLVEKFIATTAILNENWLIRRSYPHVGKCKMRVISTFFLTHSPRLLYCSEKLQSTFLPKYFFWIVWRTAILRKIFWENLENLEKTKNFDICFSIFLRAYAKKSFPKGQLHTRLCPDKVLRFS